MTSETTDGPWVDYQQAAAAAQPDGPWVAYQQAAALTEPRVGAPRGIANALLAGVQASATGLAVRRELPSAQLPEDANMGERIAFGAANVVTDLPLSIAGAMGFAPVGTAVGGAATVNPVGAAVGGVVGAGVGAVGVPMAVRDALMQAYQQGGVNSFADVWEIALSGAVGFGKGAVIGGLTAGAGRGAGALTAGAVPVVRGTAVAGAEIGTLATAGAAVEGHLPTSQDFMDAAVMVGGMKVAISTAAKLRSIYAKTGKTPDEVAIEASKDPTLKKEITESNEIPVRYKELAAEENAKAAVPELTPQDRARMAELQAKPFEDVPQIKGEPTQPTHINYNYINGPEELSGALSRLSKFNEVEIQKARRGTVKQSETAREAQTVVEDVLNGKLAPEHMAPELGNLDARLVAMKQIVVDSAAAWREAGRALAEKGTAASAAEVADFLQMTQRLSMIHAEFLGKRAEVGRALNAMKIITESSTDLKALTDILRTHGGPEQITALAELAAKTESPAQAAAMAKKFVQPTAIEKVIEVWKASILSGPKTHLANILGNINGMFIQPIDRAAGAVIGTLLRTPKAERIKMAEVPAEVTGMVHGVLDGLKLAGEVVRGKAPIGEKVDMRPGGAVGGLAGEVVRIPFKLLTASDALFRTMAERGEAYALATRQAYKEGLQPGTREYNAKIVELVANPTEEMAAAIEAQGNKAVFTTRLGKMGMHLQMAVRGTPLEFILPFIRTPANLLKWGAEHLPGVNLLLKEVREDIAAGGVRRDMALGRMVVGGVIATVVFNAAEEGVITGGGLAEPEKMRAKKAAGWQPYSIKIGDKYYSYARLDPVGRILSAAADTAELTAALESTKKTDVAAMIAASIGNATISQTYLSGLANAVNAITDPTRYGARWIDQYAASLIPGAIGQTAVAKDPYVREINTMLDAVQSRIPVLREELLPKRNPLTGEPVKAAEGLFPMAPINVTQESSDKVLTEAARLGVPLSGAPKSLHVGTGTGKVGDVKISDEARNKFVEKQGEFAHKILEPMVNSPMWDSLPDMVKDTVYRKAIKASRRMGALEALPPEARAEESQRIAAEILGNSVVK